MKTHYFLLFVLLGFFSSSCTNHDSIEVKIEEDKLLPEFSNFSSLKTAGIESVVFYNEEYKYSHTIKFVKRVYEDEKTTFTYDVISYEKPTITYWLIQIDLSCCDNPDYLIKNTKSNEEIKLHFNSETGILDLIFIQKYEHPYINRSVTFTIPGEWYAGKTSVIGEDEFRKYEGTLLGPVCEKPNNEDSISGTTFFDINGDGVQQYNEPGIPGVKIILESSEGGEYYINSDLDGFYEFSKLKYGKYRVIASELEGMLFTTPQKTEYFGYEGKRIEGVNFGYKLDLSWMEGECANGLTPGYWKNNLIKAIEGKTNGVQVDAETLKKYVEELSNFALLPLNPKNLKEAYKFLSYNGSDTKLILKKHLMASEFNFANKANIGGNEIYTYCLLWYGEYLLLNAEYFTDTQIEEAKDWFDAYNNSNGKAIK